jgi:hypothetical protein
VPLGLGLSQKDWILHRWSLQTKPESPSYMSKNRELLWSTGQSNPSHRPAQGPGISLASEGRHGGPLCSDTSSKAEYERSKIVDGMPGHAPSRWHGEILGLPLAILFQAQLGALPACHFWYSRLQRCGCMFVSIYLLVCLCVSLSTVEITSGWVSCKGV